MKHRALGFGLRAQLRAALLSVLLTAFANAQEATAVANIPASRELEAQHAKIGVIHIVNGNVFATETPEENKALFRLANRLHKESRPSIIEQQLLFKTGEPYSDRLLRESERILRSNRYLYDAQIVPVRYADGVVDVEVRTRDVWTFKPGIQFGRSGGANTTGFELQESNLLGYGKEVTIGRTTTVDRTSTVLSYYDPRVAGSWTKLQTSFSQDSDGRRRELSVARPFYSLDTREAGDVYGLDWDRTDQRYNLGQPVDEFRHRQEFYEVAGGLSDGWRNGWIRRLNFGVDLARDRFGPTDSILSAQVLPPDRKLLYPFIGFTFLQDDFENRRNENQIERTEDLYAGTFIQGSIGVAQPAWGADRSAWLWTLADGISFETEERKQTWVLATNASGRIEDSIAHNVLATADATYYWRVADRQLFYAALHGATSEKLDADKQLTLGGDTGLRGYPLRYQDGTALALLTLEHRVFTKYYLFRLFHVGGAVFFDMGRTWGTGNGSITPVAWPPGVEPHQGLLKDVGLGLRLGSSRSAFGNVIHIDFAFPLDGDSSIKKVQFVVETKTSF